MPQDITGSIVHNFDECVYPILTSRVQKSDGKFSLLYQLDEEPGLSSWGDEDAPTNNSIIHVLLPPNVGGFSEVDKLVSCKTWPNPVNDILSIDVELKKAEGILLELFDLEGRRLKQVDMTSVKTSHHSFSINIGDQAAGMYLYRISNGKALYNGKIIKR